jgi:hypothetical protein
MSQVIRRNVEQFLKNFYYDVFIIQGGGRIHSDNFC